MRRTPATASGAALTALLVAGCALSLTTGAVTVPTAEITRHVFALLRGDAASILAPHQHAVLVELRLPRTLMAVCVGCLLAQCGAVMQGVFRNPLADPGVIGVAAGAAVGAVLAIYLLPPAAVVWAVPVAAFVTGLLASIGVYRIACSPYGTSVLVLLLAGIAVSALAGSIIGLISYLADDSRLRDITLWQMGSVAGASMTEVALCFGVLVLLAWRFQYRAAALNALLLGEAEARHLGIDVETLKRELIVLVALGMGLAVASAGVIGFVGLVVPHMVRTLFGPEHARLLPLAGLAGALLLLIADIGSRMLIQPAELPVGLLTALLGAPFFIVLLLEQKGRG
jgi:iron complex transport system permease protein